ncbi:hypothetical protein [Rhodococcoides fascians]|uniref:hypothetical protein n=1 Tax=Rhodococcoides fascians TaxID=1828 RepID=UPI0037BA1FC7
MTFANKDLDISASQNASMAQWAATNRYIGPETLDAEGFKRFRAANPVDRRGLYLFECANGDAYVGISSDVMKRLRTHRTKHPDAVRFWFRADSRSSDERRNVERQLVREAQKSGLIVRNREHASGHVGVSTLDALITPDDQQRWLADPAGVNGSDVAELVDLGFSKLAAHAGDFAKLQRHPRSDEIVRVLGTYAAQCIPMARRTEATFWTVSCYPSWTRRRVFCVSMAGQETFFVVCSEGSTKLKAVLFVDRRELPKGVVGKLRMAIRKTFTKPGGHKSGGAFEQKLYFRDISDLSRALEQPEICRSIARFNLDLMRKRQSAYKTSHCRQLADAALAARPSGSTVDS